MTSKNECATTLPQARNQDLLLEVDREGSHQTELTETECSCLSNPPITDTLVGGRLNAHDQTKFSSKYWISETIGMSG